MNEDPAICRPTKPHRRQLIVESCLRINEAVDLTQQRKTLSSTSSIWRDYLYEPD